MDKLSNCGPQYKIDPNSFAYAFDLRHLIFDPILLFDILVRESVLVLNSHTGQYFVNMDSLYAFRQTLERSASASVESASDTTQQQFSNNAFGHRSLTPQNLINRKAASMQIIEKRVRVDLETALREFCERQKSQGSSATAASNNSAFIACTPLPKLGADGSVHQSYSSRLNAFVAENFKDVPAPSVHNSFKPVLQFSDDNNNDEADEMCHGRVELMGGSLIVESIGSELEETKENVAESSLQLLHVYNILTKNDMTVANMRQMLGDTKHIIR